MTCTCGRGRSRRGLLIFGCLIAAGLFMVTARADEPPFRFEDVGQERGLFPEVGGIMGHAAGWGDANGDGLIDLYVATFHQQDSKPNMFFLNRGDRFEAAESDTLRISTRATGALFADLDNDGDLDLYVSSMPRKPRPPRDGAAPRPDANRTLRGCTLFRNDGDAKFTDVSKGNAACPDAFGGRSATVLDYDGDGLLDLFVGEDPFPGYNGSQTKRSRMFHNLGNLKFEDVTDEVGLPEVMPGLGVAAGDVNNDGRPDIFAASAEGGNRLLLNTGKGTFREAAQSPDLFHWPDARGDDMVCGAHFGDVNADGLLDLVVGQHFSSPWLKPVPIRLYLNRGVTGGEPKFEDVTDKAGLVPLPLKAPHVEIQDFDNDGIPDIYTSQVKLADGRRYPIIFKGQGTQGKQGGVPRFEPTGLDVNDFPTDADRAITRSGPFFEHMIEDGKIIYMAPGPSGDFDNDGRLDLFLANWWVESPSMLLRNETPGGNWLQVQVRGDGEVNRMGIGSRVLIYEAGHLGDSKHLLGMREIATGYGYASAQPAYAHFGLGEADSIDLRVVLPHGQGTIDRKDVKADQRITVTRQAAGGK